MATREEEREQEVGLLQSQGTPLVDEYPPASPVILPRAARRKRNKILLLLPALALALFAVVAFRRLPPNYQSIQWSTDTEELAVEDGPVAEKLDPLPLSGEPVEEVVEAEEAEVVDDPFAGGQIVPEEAADVEVDLEEDPAAGAVPAKPKKKPVGNKFPGVPQRIIEWTGEDAELVGYTWGKHEPHASLLKVVGGLDESEKRTRNWLLETRPGAQAGTGIGLGRGDPPLPIRPAPPASRPKGPPTANEGPGIHVSGSHEKYNELLFEWQTGRQYTPCEKGKWESKYTAMHNQMMTGKMKPKLLEYRCVELDGRGCGGLADRMLGMFTTFLYAILTNRAVSISWEHPAPFDLLFDSPFIDWSQPYHENSTSTPHPIYSNEQLRSELVDYSFLNWTPKKIDEFFPTVPKLWASLKEPWIRMRTNRGFVLRAFRYPEVKKQMSKLGIKYETAYSCMINYLIRPKPDVLEFVAQYTSLFSLPTVYSIAIQVRTGDASMKDPATDALNTVAAHQNYFTCAAQVAKAYAHPTQKIVYYLLSDSPTLKADALAQFPDQVVVSGLDAVHAEVSVVAGGTRGEADGLMGSIAESWTLAGTDFQILTARSGFGKIPTWLRGKPGSTVVVPKPGSANPPPMVDCGTAKAIVSWDTLASTWSLG